jgi:hypothetical protein
MKREKKIPRRGQKMNMSLLKISLGSLTRRKMGGKVNSNAKLLKKKTPNTFFSTSK